MDEYTQVMQSGGYRLLDNKIVLKITNNPEKFLNALTTNELTKPKNAFLDKFGRLIALVDQIQTNDTVYLVLEAEYKESLLNHLNKYTKLTNTKITEESLIVIHLIGDHAVDGLTINQPIGTLALLSDISSIKNIHPISLGTYDIIKLENNIPTQGVDFENNMFLEANILDAISFTKGCYLGQEIVARVHHQGKPPKKLIRVLYDKLPKKVTSDGEEIGKITSSCFSPAYQKYLAFVMAKDKLLDEGEKLKEDHVKSPEQEKRFL